MEPNFESKPSVEFEKTHQHIFSMRDVLIAFRENIEIEVVYGTESDVDYMAWIQQVLCSGRAIGSYVYMVDAAVLEKIIREGKGEKVYESVGPEITSIIERLKAGYAASANEEVDELNDFIRLNKGLLLWSSDPEDVIEEITLRSLDNGMLAPAKTTKELFVDVSRLDENYRPIVTEALSDL